LHEAALARARAEHPEVRYNVIRAAERTWAAKKLDEIIARHAGDNCGISP